MARRRREREQPNHERWLVSYADFITLLFAFFVVMYAISSVNEGKYRVLSQTLYRAFSEPVEEMRPIQSRELPRPVLPVTSENFGFSMIEIQSPLSQFKVDDSEGEAPSTDADVAQEQEKGRRQLEHIAAQVKSELAAFIETGLVDVTNHGSWVEVNMKSNMLFESGSARLSLGAIEALQGVVDVLMPLKNPVHVEGYTDDVPISTPVYPSNWELSAARAASVVHYFTRQGMRPARLAAIGYGEHRPVSDNATVEGRQRNRRVTLIIMSEDFRQQAGRFMIGRAFTPADAEASTYEGRQ